MLNNIQEIASVKYNDKFDEFSIACNDGTQSRMCLFFCPWCGKKLPNSKRERWFNELELLGFDNPLFDENIPTKYKTKAWWEDNHDNQGTAD